MSSNKLQKDPNIPDEMYKLLHSQFKDKQIIEDIFYTIAEQKNKIRDLIVESSEYRLIDNAEGEVLDEVGKQENVERYSTDDPTYRTRIKLNAYKLGMRGTTEDLIDVLSRSTGAPAENVYISKSGNVIGISVLLPCPDKSVVALRDVADMLPINTNYKISGRKSAKGFGFGSVHSTVVNSNVGGFSSVHGVGTNSAPFATLITTSN